MAELRLFKKCFEVSLKVTIVLLTHHRLELIKLCIESIRDQCENSLVIEIIALLNGGDSETENYLKACALHIHNFTYIKLKKSIPVGEARNLIIDKATGSYLCFIDDDVEIPSNYMVQASKFIEADWDVFGGPDTHKAESSNFQLILSQVMKSFFAMGPTALRHSLKVKSNVGNERNLILCNLWMKKSLFGEGFRFPAGYLRNEENILIGKLEKAQKKMLYTSDLIVFHERKKSFSKLIKVTYLSGKYRTYGFFDSKETINLWFFVPQVFIIVLTILSILKLSYFGLMFLVYILSIFIISIINTYQIKKIHLFPLAMNFYIIYNFVYPIGQFCGYLARCKRKRI